LVTAFPVAAYVANILPYATKMRDKKILDEPGRRESVAGFTSYATSTQAANSGPQRKRSPKHINNEIWLQALNGVSAIFLGFDPCNRIRDYLVMDISRQIPEFRKKFFLNTAHSLVVADADFPPQT
jgi:hypothetical protein